jgi:small-conductance mechanosensitive channel
MADAGTELMGVHLGPLGAGLAVLLLVAIAHFALRWFMQRRVESQKKKQAGDSGGTTPAERKWFAASVLDLVAPLALLLWIHGLYYALSSLATDMGGGIARYGMPVLDTLRGLGTILALIWLLARIGRAIEARLIVFARHTHSRSDDFLLPIVGTAIRLLLPLLAVILGSSMLAVPERLQALFRNGVSMMLVAAFAYVLYRLVDAACELLLERYPIDVPDNGQARAVRTQVTVLRKVAVSAIVLFAFAGMLMVFDEVRQIGATILASAGVAGIVIGFAAQRSLGTLLAGFQIALTQPIRIGDSVIVEGEFGTIEEITLTYVVVSIWDQRRLIVPITFFLEKSFQNWTRTSVALLGTVELYVDYDFPIQRLREKLDAVLENSKFWDRRVKAFQVTDAREQCVQVRALVSAANAGAAFDLRCEVREALLRFLQQEHPESLPRVRVMRAQSAREAGTGH